MQRKQIESLIEIKKQKGECYGISCDICYLNFIIPGLCRPLTGILSPNKKERFEQRLQLSNKFLREEKLNRICKQNMNENL